MPASFHHAPSFTLEALWPLGPYTSHFPLSIACSLASASFPNTHVDPREKAVESRVIQLPAFNYLPCDQLNLLFYSCTISIRVVSIYLITGSRENLLLLS